MNIPRPLAECLLKVRNLDEFKPLREYLDAEEAKHMAFLMTTNEDRPMHVAQGMLRALNALTNLIQEAPSLLDKQSRPTAAKIDASNRPFS